MPILYLCKVNVTRLYYGTDTEFMHCLRVCFWVGYMQRKKKRKNFYISLSLIVILVASYFIFAGKMPIVYLLVLTLTTILSMFLIEKTAK